MTEENQQTPNNDGISEDELRGLIGNAVDEKLNERGLTKEAMDSLGGIGAFVEKLFTDNKSEPMNEDGLLEKIGNLVDEKLKGISTGGGNGSKEHEPKIKIFG
jgi:hypothetical protein